MNRQASEPCGSGIMATENHYSKDEVEKLRHLKSLKAEEALKESYRVRRKRF